MFRTLMKSKIHRATVTRTNLQYKGSITIDEELAKRADLVENELVQIVNVNNGARFETYVILGEAGSRCIELNGAAARLAEPGDIVIIISYGMFDAKETELHKPVILMVDEHNDPVESLDIERNEEPLTV
ncbi:aspartate 1-decarboxylase [Alicyclobacillus mengziensis]|uniref:Aspartate 1-decarboxylase n=1 Tax=Alicyclobacillus mengziensis TaxID=2931921 RepID=A0A9X7Z871_9BACL|nr:aspartate 1-decarboxylase [Alicyclobacillus mengziensis]QSO47896.1 aspartate 1-decarboxylase [Alicyclobacillus mengziensis]